MAERRKVDPKRLASLPDFDGWALDDTIPLWPSRAVVSVCRKSQPVTSILRVSPHIAAPCGQTSLT